MHVIEVFDMKLKFGGALLAFVTAIIPLSVSAESGPLPQDVASRDAARTYANLPLRFEAAAEPGYFLARSGGYAVLVGAGESAIAIADAKSGAARTLRFRFEGSSATARIEAIEALPGVTNYYIGQDSSKWRLGVRNFAKLRAKDVYPGVDVVYYGDQRRLEFDFVVAPMADPRAIALTLSGMDKLYIDADGELVAEVNGHAVRFAKPYAYQKVAGSAQAVSVEYALAGAGKAQLQIGDYDKNLELVIDPTLSYSTYLGGSQGDTANGIAVDASGNAYITGQTCSIGLDASPVKFPSGTPNNTGTTITEPLEALGACDAYVTKLGPTGTVLFTTFMEGTAPTPANAFASGNGIALDNVSLNKSPVPNGYPNVYVVGTTSFQDMPIPKCSVSKTTGYCPDLTHPSAAPTWPNGDNDPFIAILDSQTGTLIRFTYLGGNGLDYGYAIAVDTQQNVIVAGKTSSFNFPAYNGFEPITEVSVAFVTKLDFGLHIAPPILPGASPMSPRVASATDTCGSICPATPDPTTAYYFFSAVYGGQLVAPPPTWPVDNTGAVIGSYVSGVAVPYGAITTATPSGCPNTLQNYPAMRIFAVNLGTSAGITWGNCTSFSINSFLVDAGGISWEILGVAPFPETGSASTEAYGVALDPGGDVFAVGGSSTTQLHPSLPGGTDWLPQADTFWNGTGSWIIKLHGHDTSVGAKNAGWPVYLTALETNMTNKGATVDAARAITIDSQNNAYVVGTTTGTLLSATGLNESPLGTSPSTDAYILKLQTPAEIGYATYLGGTGNDQGLGVAVDAGGYAYIIGSTQSTDIPVINAVIDGGGNSLNQLKNTQHPEAYLAKITPDGTALIMSAYLGGSAGDQGNAIALSPSGNGDIYLAGNTNSYDFPLEPLAPASPVVGISQYALNGDAFVTKILGASFPALKISPVSQSLTFADQTVGFSSAATQTVTLTSTGQVPLLISSITTTGDFKQANTCGTGLPGASSSQNTCTITVTFTPTAVGTRSGTLTISDDATSSPQQTVGLQGNGTLVQDSVSPTTLAFPSTTLGTTSAALTVTVQNTDSTQTLILSSSPVISGDFSLSSNGCTSLLAPAQSCTIGVVFTPTAPGSRSGTLIINGNGNSFPATVQLTGTGNGAGSVGSTGSSGFTLTASATSVSVTKGTPATFGVTVTTTSLFTGTIQLSCVPTGNTTCTIAPSSITVVSGTTSYPATVTVNVPVGNTVTVTELIKPGRLLATLLPFGGIGLVLAGRRRRWLLVLGLAVWLVLGMVACGGSSSSSSGSSSPQVTITATPQSGSAQAVAVALSVS